MNKPQPTSILRCITGDQYEELARRHRLGLISDRQIAEVERHVIECPKCRAIWALEAELNHLPADVVAVHTDTINSRSQRTAAEAAGVARHNGARGRQAI